MITDGASTWEQLPQRRDSFACATSIRSCWCRIRTTRSPRSPTRSGSTASVSSTDGASSIRQLLRETAAVSLGRIVGYRRVDNWLDGVG